VRFLQRCIKKVLQRAENRIANRLLVLLATALAKPQRQIDECIFRQIVSNGVHVASYAAHPHCTHFKKARAERRLQNDLAQLFQIDLLLNIG